MPRTEAQLAASRANGLKSKGPITAEGKALSRRNALKHGMAGRGVLVPEADALEVERRSAAMLDEMRPTCEMGAYLVRRMARLTVRVERCAAHELAANEYRAAHAEADFDEARVAEVDHTLAFLIREPATYARKLRSMPEGVDRLIADLLALREELNTGRWDWTYGDRLANLTGRRWAEVPETRARALSEAIVGDFRYLLPSEGEGLSDHDRIDWARNAVAELIDEEIDGLLEHRKALDVEGIALDRAGAAERSAFDPSKEAILARRYEAAAERAVYRALEEFRRVEAESAALMTVPAAPDEEEEAESSGSFGAGVATPPRPAPGRPTHRKISMPSRVGGPPRAGLGTT